MIYEWVICKNNKTKIDSEAWEDKTNLGIGFVEKKIKMTKIKTYHHLKSRSKHCLNKPHFDTFKIKAIGLYRILVYEDILQD